MYQNDVPYSFSGSVPGKVFLFGEYAVLQQLPAVILTIEPRFKMRAEHRGADYVLRDWAGEYPPKAPVARLMDWATYCGLPELSLSFEDPYSGGGFGASSAQFALAYWAYTQVSDWKKDWQSVWKIYRELTSRGGASPSGADLVAQWRGGVSVLNLKDGTHSELWNAIAGGPRFLIFSASEQKGRKVLTHQHLEELSGRGVSSSLNAELFEILNKGVKAMRFQKWPELGQAMLSYAQALSNEGLELEETHADRTALSALPDVLGVKGAGALQADAIVVLMKQGTSEGPRVIEKARERGLRLVSDGLTLQAGVESDESFVGESVLGRAPVTSQGLDQQLGV